MLCKQNIDSSPSPPSVVIVGNQHACISSDFPKVVVVGGGFVLDNKAVSDESHKRPGGGGGDHAFVTGDI